MDREEQLVLARRNVGFAADEAARFGVEVLVEAATTFENGPYLLHTTAQAVSFVKGLGGKREDTARSLPHAANGGEPDRKLTGEH
jgi:hydroxypyruvate isomerase